MEVKIRMGKIIKAYEDVVRARNHVVFMNQHGNEKDREDAIAMRERVVETFRREADGLTTVLNEAQARCTERTIGAEDVAKDLNEYDERLSIPEKYMKGVKIWIDHNAQRFPQAYKYTPQSTTFYAEHNGKEWVITAISREVCTTKKGVATLTEEAKNAVLEAICKV